MMIYRSKEEHAANRTPKAILQARRNVTCVFAGTKRIKGVDTGRPCIVVGVSKKIPRGQLGVDDILPGRVEDMIVDVVEIGPFKAGGT